MYVIGIVRYGERARALWRANLDNIKPQDSSGSADTEETIKMKDDIVASRIRRRLERKDLNDDGEALLLAQDLIMCKVVEMELSLMYELLYIYQGEHLVRLGTLLLHTYLIRFTSPLATAAAASLFWLHREQGGGRPTRGSFVGITYALLGVNFLLDMTWLLRALGSTWTYANLV
nr:unnamed protein product [Digitaria exilis]